MVDESLLREYPEVARLRYLFLDLNAYFASVEQQEHPELRGKPIAVVPVEADTSFIIAASYEAKAFGIKTGTRIGEAKIMCPNLILRKGTPHMYTYYHKRVIDAVEMVLPVEKVCSIDEMRCRLIGEEREPDEAKAIALRVKAAIRENAGDWLKASIGIAPNPFLAKVGTDMMKPDGLVILQHTDLPEALYKLELTDIAGINRRMAARLQGAGIFSVKDMCAKTKGELRSAWGSIVGERWWYMLRGVNIAQDERDRKSLSNSHVMAPKLRTDEGSKEVLLRLLQKASARLRAERLAAGHMQISVSGRTSWQDQARINPTCDSVALTEHFLAMWAKRKFSGPVKVGLVFSDLEEMANLTPSLFDHDEERHDLSVAIDELNQKFGKNTVYLAGMERAKNAAPERIAFDKVELFKEGKGDHEWPNTFRPFGG